MRFRNLSVTLGIVMSVCVSIGQTPSAGESGIEGTISIYPSQPGPSRSDAPDSKPLSNTAFVVKDLNGEVTSFTTDDQGQFRIPLAPGHYAVSMKGRKLTVGHFGPFEVDVLSGKMTKVQWKCDSGIR